jgi:predicted TIM-barrel fold metal-dependent hydrolase
MLDTPSGPRFIFDAHTHFFTHSFYARLGEQTGLGPHANAVAAKLGWDRPPEDPADVARRWLAEMDRHGVDRMVAIHTLPGDIESAARGVQAAAGRLVGYAMINPLAEDALQTAQRAVNGMGFRGLALFPAMFRFSMTSDPVYALLDLANRHGLNVFVHCGVLKVGFRTKLGLRSAFDAAFSNPLSLQRPAAEFPQVNFIIPHLGSGLFRELLMLADQVGNVYADTSGLPGWARYLEGAPTPAHVLRQAIHVMGSQRLLFGSDSTFFPRGWRRDVFDQQMAVFEEAHLTDSDVRQILGENLQRLLPAIAPTAKQMN